MNKFIKNLKDWFDGDTFSAKVFYWTIMVVIVLIAIILLQDNTTSQNIQQYSGWRAP